jgi:two-component system sensor histidine kinase/response regulator
MSKQTVLIVDDTPANLGVLVEYLTAAGYRTLIAEDGEDALEQVHLVLPDIILLDIMMPGLDGFETCKRLKADERTRDIPVLFMTALSGTEDKVRGFGVGAIDYVTKPLQSEEVLARVRTHLTLRAQRAQIEEQAALLEQRNEMNERFMRIASHDLRNLLSVMSLRCSLLLEGDVPPKAVFDEALAKLKTSIGRMNDIIHGFLSHSGGGDFEIHSGRVDLDGLLAEVVGQYRSLAAKKGIDLVCDCGAPDSDLPLVRADGARTHQVLTNYVSNALKFSPPGTAVLARAQLAEGFVRVEVRDEGPGIRPAERAMLFSEFAKLSNKPTGGEESTGLGLSIVKRLVQAQGGRVGADFPEDGGSVFWAELPAALDEASADDS